MQLCVGTSSDSWHCTVENWSHIFCYLFMRFNNEIFSLRTEAFNQEKACVKSTQIFEVLLENDVSGIRQQVIPGCSGEERSAGPGEER